MLSSFLCLSFSFPPWHCVVVITFGHVEISSSHRLCWLHSAAEVVVGKTPCFEPLRLREGQPHLSRWYELRHGLVSAAVLKRPPGIEIDS
jgi:hypothetical protein